MLWQEEPPLPPPPGVPEDLETWALRASLKVSADVSEQACKVSGDNTLELTNLAQNEESKDR